MKKNYSSIISVVIILGILGFLFASLMPSWSVNEDKKVTEFSTSRALEHINAIAKQPHYVGTKNHEVVANYIINELQKLGLETTVQEGFTLSDWGNLVKSKNIMCRIEGTKNTKALLLLSHYDSAPHSVSHGASDDASGVATILEGVRAFLNAKTKHQNDIIILFTDAEELGLNGAALFVTEHQWAKEVGLVLNFEARGSSGPSYMLMETNKGNAGLVKEFAKAGATYPVSNSLMYSIYKMLPNDTDLTVFREQGNIQGFNFAFIDGHFNYHTQQDDVAHLDKSTLKHQGSYLMPLLNYFSNADLNATASTTDDVYFTIPFTFISYPFDWVVPMTLIAAGLLIILVFLGKAKRMLKLNEIMKGFFPFLGALIFTGLITYYGWKGLLWLNPQYNDLLIGFTYNGHDYIAAFVLLSLSICFFFYQIASKPKVTMNHYVIPLLFWIVLNGFLANSLRGAGFLIIPVYFGLIAFAVFVFSQRSNWIVNLICGIPALLIIAPFIQMFPIGLGLKVLFGSAILTVLAFTILLPIFGAFTKKGAWSFFFFLTAITFLGKAQYHSGYELGEAKSNSLVYLYNADNNRTYWLTYDTNLDSWTKGYLGEKPKGAKIFNDLKLFSKYNSEFTYAAEAPNKGIAKPTITFIQDSVVGFKRYLKIQITPNRKVNRYDIFANQIMTFFNFKANGVTTLGQKGTELERNGKKLLSYYVVNNEPLVLQFTINRATVLDMDVMESSFDLMVNPLFAMTPREDWMIPTPFVLNDAIIITQKLRRTPKVVAPLLKTRLIKPEVMDSLKIIKDSLRIK
ncbi:M20/M25/M40 family metallo-hydrolase [Flavobacterium taihuense]|uniref:M20/M25/M40 family metallo-hydrolase n=1 Tax=Flavobacterium taihuense TaxID=2857508 RepID=A0ABS6XWW7_9FLAO|nr:M20/M25/M40 family metallo-hydrolase [Flavobacterium taihuense]MBW4361178.1 M20/M25/M40 family metallo-hydrolase [Flavobacterium taihuense]